MTRPETARQPVRDQRTLGRQHLVLGRLIVGRRRADRVKERLLLIRGRCRLVARFGSGFHHDPDVLAQGGEALAKDGQIAQIRADAVEGLVPALRELIELIVGQLGLRLTRKRAEQQDQKHAP